MIGFVSQNPVALSISVSNSLTLELSHAECRRLLTNSATAIDITIPLASSVAFPDGAEIEIIKYGAGNVTFVVTGGVTLYSRGSYLSITDIYAGATLVHITADTWLLIGAIA